MHNVASRIIKKCGGFAAVAALVGVDVSRVHRWTYPKERGGTDGLIPTRQQQVLLTKAVEKGIDLTADDFFADPSSEAKSA